MLHDPITASAMSTKVQQNLIFCSRTLLAKANLTFVNGGAGNKPLQAELGVCIV
jgi:hypothetical protein